MGFDAIANIASSIPTDWMIIGAFAIFAAFDCLRSGARRASALALALPITVLLFSTLPDMVVLGPIAAQFSTPILQAVLFLILLSITYIFVGRIGLSWGGEAGQTLQAALAGVALTAIVLVFWLETPALNALWQFGAQVQGIFDGTYRFGILLASYGTLAFVRNS